MLMLPNLENVLGSCTEQAEQFYYLDTTFACGVVFIDSSPMGISLVSKQHERMRYDQKL